MIELEKVHYFFKATILLSPSYIIILKPTYFRVYGKYILVSSRAKFTRLLCLKLMLIKLIKSLYFEFLLANCPSDIISYFLTGPGRGCQLQFFLRHLLLVIYKPWEILFAIFYC